MAAACALAMTAVGAASPQIASASSGAAGAASGSTTIVVDGHQAGRVFQGEGAISGGGATSRLLLDYPKRQQNQILDYLFKSDYGASLQQLKVEIGSGANSTEGSESSIEPARGQLNCNAGYEWWIMEQAKERNPHITFGALEWGAPGWFQSDNGKTDDADRFFSQDNIDYIIAWLGCAKSHGLQIENVGVWNEHPYDATWIERLRTALNVSGYASTQIAAADDCCGSEWNIAADMAQDPALKNAVGIVGAHYPGAQSTQAAQDLGKPLWASEDGPWSAAWGATSSLSASIPEDLNLNYINGRITSTQIWNLITAYYDNLSTPDAGLMLANTPWARRYSVQSAIWAMAQTTQFTQPGWHYIDSASGYLNTSEKDAGSYVSLHAPSRGNWSTIIETMQATAPRTVNLSVAGGLRHGVLHVWRTTATDWFQHVSDLRANAQGQYSLTVQPGAVYSITSTTGQHKGTAAPQDSTASSAFPFPYADNFNTDRLGQQPRYFYQMLGDFRVQQCGGGRGGRCLAQILTQAPIPWGFYNGTEPLGTIGDPSWHNYQVSVDAFLPGSGTAQLLGRMAPEAPQGDNDGPEGYGLRLNKNGSWSVGKLIYDGSETWESLASGHLAGTASGWRHLALTFSGTSITASIDGMTVAHVTDTQYSDGMVEVGSGWNTAQFDNLSINPVQP